MQLKEVFWNDRLHIHQRYSMLIDQLEIQSPVLKTDLWNELKTSWPIEADLYAEIDAEFVKEGLLKGLNTICCSIIKLDLENESISTIIDLSTIDHIEDPYPALKEYFRVLKNDPMSNCYLVCWLGNQPPVSMTNWYGKQYYFKENLFIKKILKVGFILIRQEIFHGLNENQAFLSFFHLKKGNNFYILPRIRVLFFSVSLILEKLFPLLYQKRHIKTKVFMKIKYDKILAGLWVNMEYCASDSGRKHLCFNALNNDPYLILPKLELPLEHFIVKLDITPPGQTNLQLFYLYEGISSYCEECSVTKTIGPDRTAINIFIPHEGIIGRLRIDLGTKPGKYIIYDVSILQSMT